MKELITEIIRQSVRVKEQILFDTKLLQDIETVSDEILKSFQRGKRVFLCGNGGSASDAQHIAAEFSGRFYKDRQALPAEALHCNTSYLTAVANDYGFEAVYARLISGIAQQGDVLIALSTSGNSMNIIEACKAGRERGLVVIGMTGSKGGAMEEFCHHLLRVPSESTPRIQEAHIMIGHIICEIVEARYFD
jgi:D-sedoheptulose 7-phosphate isomerase